MEENAKNEGTISALTWCVGDEIKNEGVGTITNDCGNVVFPPVNDTCLACFAAISASLSAPGVAPITLIFFEGEQVEDYVKLRWATAAEFINEYFTIEKSRNGLTFEEVAQVPGSGTTPSRHDYSAIDDYPEDGSTYYRLKQTDEDGTSTTSEMIVVTMTDPEASECDLVIIPNPCPGNCIVDAEGCAESISVGLYDITGRQVSSNVPVNQGSGFYINPQNNLAPGTYIVLGTSGDTKVSTKVILE